MTLDKLAHIQLGYQFRGSIQPDPAGNVCVLQVKDLRDGQPLQAEGLVRVQMDREPTAYLLAEGDVIFLSRGHRLFATLIDRPLHRTIAPGYFYIVRVRDHSRVLPAYVSWSLNQVSFQREMKGLYAGTHMPILPMSVFRDLDIPVPSLRTQHAIVAIANLQKKEQDLTQQLQAARNLLVERICVDAATGQLQSE